MEDLEVGGRVETIQTIALLKKPRILRRVLETWGDLLSPKLQWKTISKRWCEKLQEEEEEEPFKKMTGYPSPNTLLNPTFSESSGGQNKGKKDLTDYNKE